MAIHMNLTFSFLFLSLLSHSLSPSKAQPIIGINYGQLADNLPPPSETAKLLKSTSIGIVRLYNSDPAIIKALANTGIGIVISTSYGDISTLANDPGYAKQWINSHVVPFYPASDIKIITVGNEVLPPELVPAMHNLQDALESVSLGGKIKISTVQAMSVLKNSEPPSSGSFDPDVSETMKGLLGFLKDTSSPFMINPYPFFAYQSDPRPETLAFCLFQPNSGRFDSGSKITYMNMFDAQVDSVRSALNAMDFKDVEIVVAETGWAYKGDKDEVGASIENAKAYNVNLMAHLKSMVGTPLMPGKAIDTYLFALYNENLKPGKASEQAFGLFNPDLSMTYDVGLSKGSQTPAAAPTSTVSATPPTVPPALSKQAPATSPTLVKKPLTPANAPLTPIVAPPTPQTTLLTPETAPAPTQTAAVSPTAPSPQGPLTSNGWVLHSFPLVLFFSHFLSSLYL